MAIYGLRKASVDLPLHPGTSGQMNLMSIPTAPSMAGTAPMLLAVCACGINADADVRLVRLSPLSLPACRIVKLT